MYKRTRDREVVRRLSDGAWIPVGDRKNRDSLEYMVWCATGNQPLPMDPIVEPEPPSPTVEERLAALEAILLRKAGEGK